VQQQPRLRPDGLHHFGVTVTQDIHGDAGSKVEVSLSLCVPDPNAAALHQHHREASIGVGQAVSRLRHQFVG